MSETAQLDGDRWWMVVGLAVATVVVFLVFKTAMGDLPTPEYGTLDILLVSFVVVVMSIVVSYLIVPAQWPTEGEDE